MLNTPIGRLRLVGLLEGLSFVLLLFVAMPLKYMMDMPMAVRIVGMAHGVLFLAFCAVLANTALAQKWKATRSLTFFVASLVPFGPFIADRSLKREEQGAS